jgi:hypothetical protein
MLVLHAEGASPAQVLRGVVAAQIYFATHGVKAGEVWVARIKVEDEDLGVPDIKLSSCEETIWHHWHEAEIAAKIACCGAGSAPPHACLVWQADATAKAA